MARVQGSPRWLSAAMIRTTAGRVPATGRNSQHRQPAHQRCPSLAPPLHDTLRELSMPAAAGFVRCGSADHRGGQRFPRVSRRAIGRRSEKCVSAGGTDHNSSRGNSPNAVRPVAPCWQARLRGPVRRARRQQKDCGAERSDEPKHGSHSQAVAAQIAPPGRRNSCGVRYLS